MDRAAAIERYAGGYEAVMDALAGITEDELDRAPDGGWSARWVIHHLADAEATAYVRLCRLLADQPAVDGNDQEALARALDYGRPIAPSLALFWAAREASRSLLEASVQPEPPDGGPPRPQEAALDGWLRIYTEHAHEHAEQIRRARRGEDAG